MNTKPPPTLLYEPRLELWRLGLPGLPAGQRSDDLTVLAARWAASGTRLAERPAPEGDD